MTPDGAIEPGSLPAPARPGGDATMRLADRLEMLHRVDRAILDADSFAALAERTADIVAGVLAADRVAVARYDPANGVGYRVALARPGDEAPEPAAVQVPLERLVSPSMVRRPRVLAMPDLSAIEDPEPGVSFLLAQGLVAGLFVPLVAHGTLQGGLVVGWRDASGLTDEHVAIAREAADQLAIAIVHAVTHERLERQASRLALLHDIDAAILRADTPGDVARATVDRLLALTAADLVAVSRYAPGRTVLAVAGLGASHVAASLAAGPPVTAPPAVLDPSGAPRIFRDLREAARALPPAALALEQGCTLGMAVPLVAGGRVIGALNLAGTDEALLHPDSVAVAREVADQLAISMAQADQRDDLERGIEQQRLVHEIDEAILASEQPDDLASRVAAPLARLAHAARLDISAYDLERDEGRILAFAHDGSSRATPVGRRYTLRTLVPMVSLDRPTTHVFEDIREAAERVPVLRNAVAAGLSRAAWVPLLAGGRLVGAIGMAGDDPAMIGEESLALARAMGDQLAVALQHAADRAALAEREARLQAILDASPNGILVVDRTGTIQYANPAAHILFGAAGGSLAGMSHASIVPVALAERHPEHVAAWFDDDGSRLAHPLTIDARRIDGTVFPVHVLLARVATAAEPLAIATVVDLSDRTALEARLRQAERLEVLGRFAGILAHDVRNYLTAIAWSADVLGQDLADDPERLPDVELIQRATQDAVAMTRSVLEFARPTGDPRGTTAVGAHLAGAKAILDRILGDRVALELDVEPGLPLAGINPTALTQVIANLATNARDAMPDGGTFRISARAHTIGGSGADPDGGVLEPGRYVRLSVSDTGTGMDETTRDRAFEAFFTTKTMASTARGTGLGLSSVFLIVTKTGGSVRVDSAPGEGTTFTVDLPALG